jgi:hypothetical protein
MLVQRKGKEKKLLSFSPHAFRLLFFLIWFQLQHRSPAALPNLFCGALCVFAFTASLQHGSTF